MPKIIKTPPKAPMNIKVLKKESPFQKSKNLQDQYARALRAVAREVGRLIKGYAPTDLLSVEKLRRALRAYAEILEPWALTLAGNILRQVDRQDYEAWREHSRKMSEGLRRELLNFSTGLRIEDLRREAVKLITSIPIEAADRVYDLVTENLVQSARADEISEKIMATEGVTKSRATLIARTEIARAASVLTQARAENVGSEGYIWRTSKDLIVRESHRKMEGKFIKWSETPILSDGTSCHAGQIYNCRCWPEPVVPEGNYE